MALNPTELFAKLQNGEAADVLRMPTDAGNPVWHWNRCRALIAMRKYRDAVTEGASAWELRAKAPDGVRPLIAVDYGYALCKVGDYVLAVHVLSEATRYQASDLTRLWVWENYGHSLCMAGRLADGLIALGQAAEIAQTLEREWHLGRIRYLQGRWSLRAGRVAEAHRLLTDALCFLEPEQNQWLGWALVWMAETLLALEDLEEAANFATRALHGYRDREPEVAACAMLALAKVAERQGCGQEAVEYASQALGLAVATDRDDIAREAGDIINRLTGEKGGETECGAYSLP